MGDSRPTKYPVFDGTNYAWWKHRMEHYVKSTDYECWIIIQKGPLKITTTDVFGATVSKTEDKFDENDYKKAEKNSKAVSILQYGIGNQEVNRISGCTTAKDIWDTLSLAYEGTSQVKKYRVDLLMQQYEMFTMGKDESINSLSSRFSFIINELKSLGRTFENEDIVRKILRSLTEKWQPKVTAIEEAKDLSVLTLNELMGSLMAHELNLVKRSSESSKGKGLALNALPSDEEDDEDEFAMFTKNIVGMVNDRNKKKFISKPRRFPKKRSSSTVGCFKCGDRSHQIKECPKWNDIKSRDKRDFAKKEYKSKVMAAIWGMSDSEEEEEPLEEELDAKVCLSDKEKNVRCLMAKPSDSDSEDEVINLKQKARSFTKEKVCRLLDEFIDKCRDQNDKLEAMQEEIETIAEENVNLRECLDELKLENSHVNLEKEIKRLRKQNMTLANELCQATVTETVKQQDIEASKYLNEQIVNLTKERDQLIVDLSKAKSQNTRPRDPHVERHNVDRRSLDLKQRLNYDLHTKIELLQKELANAKHFYLKWEGSQKVLDFLLKQSQDLEYREKNEGIGFRGNSQMHCCTRNQDPSQRDFRRRKYVGLPEYIICNYCGMTGHEFNGCRKRLHEIKSNVIYAKKVDKDLNTTSLKKGPKAIWVPKLNV